MLLIFFVEQTIRNSSLLDENISKTYKLEDMDQHEIARGLLEEWK